MPNKTDEFLSVLTTHPDHTPTYTNLLQSIKSNPTFWDNYLIYKHLYRKLPGLVTRYSSVNYYRVATRIKKQHWKADMESINSLLETPLNVILQRLGK